MVDIELEELKEEFLRESEAKVLAIRSRLRERGSTPSAESLETMLNLAHQLKGAGGSYGFERISTEAAALEQALEQLNDGTSQAEAEIERRLGSLEMAIRDGRSVREVSSA